MAISFPLTLPAAPAPRNVTWDVFDVVASVASPFTLQTQDQEHQGQAWGARIEYPRMTDTQAREWVASLVALRGRVGTFLFGDSVWKAPRGSAAGTPLVNGGSQTGMALITDGWTASASGVLLKGDLIQLGSGETQRVYMILNDVNADGGGNATIDIWPRLRESPADDAPLVLNNTKMAMKLKENLRTWDVNVAKHYGIEIECVEAI
jgi:hypothetical protein